MGLYSSTDYLPHRAAAGGGASIGGAIGGSPTAGSVLYVGAGGLLAQDNANFFYDETDHQLVLGAGSAVKPSLSLVDDGLGLYQVGTNRLGIASAGVGRWEVNASGHFLAITDNSFDIGQGGATRPRSIFAGTSVHTPEYRVVVGGTSQVQLSVVSTQLRTRALVGGVNGFLWDTSAVATSGAINFFALSPPANTGQTASTEIAGFLYNSYTKQWATGALAAQREFQIKAATYAFVGASTITKAAGLYAEAPLAGTNATITNSFAAEFNAKIKVDGAVALGGGAAPTVGTIGGSGPAAAAQNEWIEIHTQNGKRFVPAWA